MTLRQESDGRRRCSLGQLPPGAQGVLLAPSALEMSGLGWKGPTVSRPPHFLKSGLLSFPLLKEGEMFNTANQTRLEIG